ncbi:NAD(P)/FAD-dependent oxidoreductase [Modestobacter sp. URMC 112]
MSAVPRHRTQVAVIGAGAIGAACALELSRGGVDVLVLERDAEWAAGCSWGNAGLVCPSHAGPYATWADVGSAMKWLLRPDSPLGIRPLPQLVPFLTRLLSEGRPARARRVLEVSRDMCLRSLEMHRQLVADGIDTGFRRAGLLDVYETPEGLERGHAAADVHRASGLSLRVLDAAQVRDAEPALAESAVGGVLFEDEAHLDPLQYVRGVATAAEARGARLLTGAEVLDLAPTATGVELTTTVGAVHADTVVVAAGAWSGRLADVLGRPVPLEAGKGHTVDLAADGREPLHRPLMLPEARVAITPLDGRLRLGGTMQFAGLDERIDRRRLEGVRSAGRRMLPGWADAPTVSMWAGLRPCSPDGLPYVGWLDPGRVLLATGHAMLGLTLAPLTGKQVSDLLAGSESPDAAALDPRRFRRSPRGVSRSTAMQQ